MRKFLSKKSIYISVIIIMCVLLVELVSCSNHNCVCNNAFYVLKMTSPEDSARPIIVDNYTINNDGNKLHLREKDTGKIKWTYEFKHNLIGTPKTDMTFVYAVTSHELVSIDIETGNEVWKKETTSEFISEVFLYKENLYILGPERLYSIASKLEEPVNGRSESVGQVHINQILYDYNMINENIGVVINLNEDMAFIVLFENETNKFSRIVAIKISGYNMKQIWSYSSNMDINSILSFDDKNRVFYFSSVDGLVHALKMEDGSAIY